MRRGGPPRVSDLLWSFDELVRFTKWEDAEVRFWAIDRLIRHYAADCCDAIAPFLLDDHDATPAMVARHLGEHGSARHHAILVRGFKLLRAAANYAWCNRQILMWQAREVFERVMGKSWESLGMNLVYDVAHNIAKFEEHEVEGRTKRVWVHRKGATRAYPPGHREVVPT